MTPYKLTFEENYTGEIIVEVIQADTLSEAKRICKQYYSVKKFI